MGHRYNETITDLVRTCMQKYKNTKTNHMQKLTT